MMLPTPLATRALGTTAAMTRPRPKLATVASAKRTTTHLIAVVGTIR